MTKKFWHFTIFFNRGHHNHNFVFQLVCCLVIGWKNFRSQKFPIWWISQDHVFLFISWPPFYDDAKTISTCYSPFFQFGWSKYALMMGESKWSVEGWNLMELAHNNVEEPEETEMVSALGYLGFKFFFNLVNLPTLNLQGRSRISVKTS